MNPAEKSNNKPLLCAAASCVSVIILKYLCNAVLLLTFLKDTKYSDMIFLMIVTTVTQVFPIAVIYKPAYKRLSPLIITDRKKRKNISFSLLVSAAGFLICTVLNFIISVLLMPSENSGVYIPDDLTGIVVSVFAVCVFPAVLEELLVRGAMLNSLRIYGDLAAVMISAAAFGALHNSISSMLYAFLCGIVLGCVRIYTGRLSASAAVHFLNNLLALIFCFTK